jgi:orotate phosphoribosyltransferase
MKSSVKELTKQIIKNEIIKFGDFTLKSGKKSWFYLDLRLLPSFPETFNLSIKCFKESLKHIKKIDALAGIAVGGIPFSSVLGNDMKLPSLIVRMHHKDHGMKKKIEGVVFPGADVVLIDDLITTGSSKIPAIMALRESGYKINDMVVLVDRSQGNLGQLEGLGVNLHSSVSIEEIFKNCLVLEDEFVSSEIKELIEKNL